ncbi:Trafficking protein particle complex subunit 33 [Nakaseomyces bracarensis]|uniref:Trafficking protein particle complex subunit 33 n=1 Tax=Nakaseomyces bracarensis TaxID=273131 RepID=A0ABR4NM11_9SACH
MERPEPMTEQQRAQQQHQIFQNSLPKVNQLAFSLLLNELVPMSMAVENELHEIAIKDQGNRGPQSIVDEDNDGQETDEEVRKLTAELDTKAILDVNIPKYKKGEPSHRLIKQISELEDEYMSNHVSERLQNIGFQIGSKICELLVFTNNPNLSFKDMDLLSVMKFVCRDVWKLVYNKPIDNLKTNHRGTFYLLDYDYLPIQPFALDSDQDKELKSVEPFLEIPVGLIKGVLSSLGFPREEVVCIASYIERPDDRPRSPFPKGISFHVQVNGK